MDERFSVSLVSGSETFLLRMVMSRLSVKNFCLTVLKTSVEETFSVSKVFWYRKTLGIREGEAITSFRQFFLSHSTESFRRVTMLCSTKYRVTISFLPRSGISAFSKETLFCHSTEKLRRATLLCIHNVFGIEKTHGYDEEREGLSRFSLKTFLSHSVENVYSGTLGPKFFGSEIFYAYEGNVTIFYRKTVFSQYRKTS